MKKFITILIVLIPTLIFGYMIYTNNQGYEYEIKPLEDVEDVNVGEVIFSDPSHHYSYVEGPELLTTPAKAIENSNGIFFIGHDDEYCNGFYSSIEVATRELADKEASGTLGKGEEAFYRDLTPFLNTNYEKMGPKETYYKANDEGGPGVFPKQGLSVHNLYIDDTFGTEIYKYFQDHELVIKCNDLSLEKICVSSELRKHCSWTTTSGYYEVTESYIWVGTAEVTTEHAIGDMDEFGVFGNEGETVKLRVYAHGNNYGLFAMHFERM